MFKLTGRLVSIGTARHEGTPRAVILIREGDEETEDLCLDIDLDHEQAMAFAPHLYGYVEISIQKCDAPPMTEPKRPRLVEDQ